MSIRPGGGVSGRLATIGRVSEVWAAERRLAALRDDPVGFGRACGLTLDGWQAEVVGSRAPRILLACGRQTGKSTVAALLALHTAVYTPDATVLVLSAALRQSQELFGKVCALLAGVVAHSGGALRVPTEAETQLTLRLANHSRIIALPGVQSTVRSYSAVTLLILDEAAHVANELVYATLPMLAVSGGRLIMLSSCYGKRGVFWETWSAAERGEVEMEPWLRVRVPATDCPRISASFLAEMRGRLGDWWYRSECLAEFLDSKAAAFREEWVDRAMSENYPLWNLDNPRESGRPFIRYSRERETTPPATAMPAATSGGVSSESGAGAGGWNWDCGEVDDWGGPTPAPTGQPFPLPSRPAALVAWERSIDPVWRAMDVRQARGLW